MHKFDYSFLNNGMLPSGLVNVTASISSLKMASQFRKNDFQKVFTELEKIAKIQSVKSSNEIEGIVTTDERIVQIVQQNSAPLNHNEEEILSIKDTILNYKKHSEAADEKINATLSKITEILGIEL